MASLGLATGLPCICRFSKWFNCLCSPASHNGQVLSFFSLGRVKFPIEASSAVIACEEMAFIAKRASSVDKSV